MNLHEIIKAETDAERAIGAIRRFADAETGVNLNRALFLLQEARHFAVCWQQQRDQEASGSIDAIAARNQRDEAINRLVTQLQPAHI